MDDRSDLYCWGWNRYGEFGLGTFNSYKHIPTKVTAVDGVFQVNAGGHFTFLDDGNDNNTTSRNTPTQLNGIWFDENSRTYTENKEEQNNK